MEDDPSVRGSFLTRGESSKDLFRSGDYGEEDSPMWGEGSEGGDREASVGSHARGRGGGDAHEDRQGSFVSSGHFGLFGEQDSYSGGFSGDREVGSEAGDPGLGDRDLQGNRSFPGRQPTGRSGSSRFLRTAGMESSKFELQSPWGASNESSKHPFRFEGNRSLSSGDASHFHFSPAASPKVSWGLEEQSFNPGLPSPLPAPTPWGLEEQSLNPGLPSPLPAPTSGPWLPSHSGSRPPGGRSVTFNQDPDVFAVYDREESWEQSPASSQSLFGDGFLGARPRTPLVPSPRSDEAVFKRPTAPPGSRTSTSSETEPVYSASQVGFT